MSSQEQPAGSSPRPLDPNQAAIFASATAGAADAAPALAAMTHAPGLAPVGAAEVVPPAPGPPAPVPPAPVHAPHDALPDAAGNGPPVYTDPAFLSFECHGQQRQLDPRTWNMVLSALDSMMPPTATPPNQNVVTRQSDVAQYPVPLTLAYFLWQRDPTLNVFAFVSAALQRPPPYGALPHRRSLRKDQIWPASVSVPPVLIKHDSSTQSLTCAHKVVACDAPVMSSEMFKARLFCI